MCGQTNTPFRLCHSQLICCLRTHNWSNWGVVKEAASLISFCLPHCPAAFTRNSLHRSLPLSLSIHLLHSLLLSSWASCTRGNTQALHKHGPRHEYKSKLACSGKTFHKSSFTRSKQFVYGHVPAKQAPIQPGAQSHTKGETHMYTHKDAQHNVGKQASGCGEEALIL